MTPLPEDRRSFVKKSLATSVSISFAGLIRAHGEDGSGTTNTTVPTTIGTIGTISSTTTPSTTAPQTLGTYGTTTRYLVGLRSETLTQYRLICTDSSAGITVISWAEADGLQGVTSPKNISVRAVTSGPARGECGRVLFSKTNFTYSEDAFNVPRMELTKVVTKSLVRETGPYYNEWLAVGASPPTIKTEYANRDDQPADSGIVYAVGTDLGHLLKVNKSVLFLSSLAVTGGTNYINTRDYTTTDGKSSKTLEGAESTLGLPDVNIGAGVNPKGITGSAEIKNKTGVTISSEGILSSTRQYNRYVGENNTITYTFNGSCTSSIIASGVTKYPIMIQSRKKIVVYNKYSDGTEEIRDSGVNKESEWMPGLPPSL